MTITEAGTELLVDVDKVYTRAMVEVDVDSIDIDEGIVEARIVPYEVEADLGDGLHEIFSRAAFAASIGNPARCKVTDQQHNRTVNIGKAISLRDEHDGLYGTLKIVQTAAGRDCLLLMREEVLSDVSVEFRPMRGHYEVSKRSDGFLLRHRRAELCGVSPVGTGAYPTARVLSVRAAHVQHEREKALAYLDSLKSGPQRV